MKGQIAPLDSAEKSTREMAAWPSPPGQRPACDVEAETAPTPTTPGVMGLARAMALTFNRSLVCMAVVGLDGRWFRANPAMCALTGLTEASLREQRFHDLTDPRDLDCELAHLALLIGGKADDYVMDKRIIDRSGTSRWVRVFATLLRNEDGTPGYLLAEFEDIDATRQRASVTEDILAATGHELRTPLTAIVGYADILCRRWEQVPEATRADALGIIASQARQLTAVVGDLLTLSDLRRGDLVVHRQRVRARSAVGDAAKRWPGIDIDVRVERDAFVWADPERLGVVLDRLLDNAQKFGAAPFTLQVRNDGAAITFAVDDCGAGVPSDFESQLFEGFSQADSSPTRAVGGMGIGLAVVAGLIEVMGGTTWHEPGIPTGARFVVRLPGA